MAGRFALIPNARTGMAAVSRPPADGEARLRLTYDVEIRVNGAQAGGRMPVSGALKGPGDVLGFGKQVIGRVEPEQGLRGFEPNYLPFVEFVDADFPWRYSLDTSEELRLRPWLVLVALRPDEFEYVTQGRAPLLRIRVASPAASLPDLNSSWAHAHVQVDLTVGGAGVADVVANDPSAHFSRLFCPRKLEDRQLYHLFLVPAYESGRLAGLGRRETAEPFDAPAWGADSVEPVDLPVYFQSRFTTNQMEDAETLIRRLRGIDAAAAGAGQHTAASAADPGYYQGYARPGKTFEVQAAMRQPGAAAEPFATDPALASLLKATLEEVIAGERVDAGQDGSDQVDPLVAMPPYGWRFRPDTTLSPSRARQGAWFHAANLDLRFRHAAGLGAETVRRDQELFARICWEQYEEVLEANRRLSRLQFAEIAAERVCARLGKLPADTVLALAEPVHDVVAAATNQTLAAALAVHGTPATFASRSLRRMAAKRPIARSMESAPGGISMMLTAMPRIPGDVTPERRVRSRAAGPWKKARRAPASRAERTAQLKLQRDLGGYFGATAFQATKRARSFTLPVAQFRSTDYARAIVRTLEALPALKANFVVGGLQSSETHAIAPVYRSPVVPLPLANHLEAYAKDSLLPNVGALPENTVSAFIEDRKFIEAFLVGANHAMNAMLRWREFPTDMRGTIFRRFWDRGRSPDDPAGDDIARIHSWSGELGTHYPPGMDREADLVVVIRGDIIRKLGQLIVVINEADGSRWSSGSGIDHEPVFFGRIGRDTVYYGFDVSRDHLLSAAMRDRAFLVMYEPVGRLRFGLDVATDAIRRARRAHGDLSLPFPLKARARGYEQFPVRQAGLEAAPAASPVSWDDLSWAHVNRTPAGYIDFGRTLSIPEQPAYWGADRTSATLARSLWQKPLAAVLPMSRVL